MNILEVKQLQIMRDQRVIIDNLSFDQIGRAHV